ncbi:hypothetical protein K488DRAFT_75126, partial [Vararia minispora EC-137]
MAHTMHIVPYQSVIQIRILPDSFQTASKRVSKFLPTSMRERPSFEKWLSGRACSGIKPVDGCEASSSEAINVLDLPALVEDCDNSPPTPKGITALYNNTLGIHTETGYRLGMGEFRDQSGQTNAHYEFLLVRPCLTFVDDPAQLLEILRAHGYEGSEVSPKDRSLITTVHIDGCMFVTAYGPIGELRKDNGYDEDEPSDELPTQDALTSMAYGDVPRAHMEHSLGDYVSLAREAYLRYEDGKKGMKISIQDLCHTFAVEPAAERGLNHSLDGIFVRGKARLRKGEVIKNQSFFGMRVRIIARMHAQATAFHEVSVRSSLSEAVAQCRPISANLVYAIRRTPYATGSKEARIFERVLTPKGQAYPDSEEL